MFLVGKTLQVWAILGLGHGLPFLLEIETYQVQINSSVQTSIWATISTKTSKFRLLSR